MLRFSPFPRLSARVRVRLETVPAHGAFELGELSPDERERLSGYANAERRRQFALGRLAARRLLSRQLELAPTDVEIGIGEDGAPRAPSGFLSIAHGGRGLDAIGLAAYSDVPVGVDTEAIRARHPRLAQRILRPDEALTLPEADDATSLTLIWSIKESVLKGQRTGLRAGAQSVRLLEVDPASSTARAMSEVSGEWRITFERRGDLWLTVAVLESPTAGR